MQRLLFRRVIRDNVETVWMNLSLNGMLKKVDARLIELYTGAEIKVRGLFNWERFIIRVALNVKKILWK